MKIVRMLIQVLFLCIFLFVILTGKTALWLGIFLISTIGATVFGRFYCGYICPMNTFMSVTGKFAKKFHLQSEKIPKWMTLKLIPWVIIILMISTVILSKKIFHLEIPILLFLVLLSILFTARYEEWIFHNYICPYGALLKITGRFAKISTKVEKSQCIGCKKCEMICPSKAVQVDRMDKTAEINPELCHQCQECSIVCPKKAIQYR